MTVKTFRSLLFALCPLPLPPSVLLNVISMYPRIGLRPIACFEEYIVFSLARHHLHAAGNILLLFSSFRRVIKKAFHVSRFRRFEFLAPMQLSDGFDGAGFQQLWPKLFEERA